MIEFYGIMSERCIKETTKRGNIINALVFMVFTIVSIICSIIFCIFNVKGFECIICLSSIMVVINILLIFLPAKSIVFRLPKKITISNDTIQVNIEGFNTPPKSKVRKIQKIKHILDFGDWYIITFKLDPTDYIVCQKNLIKNSSIEVFEKRFREKIIKKY